MWAAGGAPQVGITLVIDVDAIITFDHFDGKEIRLPRGRLRLSPVAGFPDRPDISPGEASLPGRYRARPPRNVGHVCHASPLLEAA